MTRLHQSEFRTTRRITSWFLQAVTRHTYRTCTAPRSGARRFGQKKTRVIEQAEQHCLSCAAGPLPCAAAGLLYVAIVRAPMPSCELLLLLLLSASPWRIITDCWIMHGDDSRVASHHGSDDDQLQMVWWPLLISSLLLYVPPPRFRVGALAGYSFLSL